MNYTLKLTKLKKTNTTDLNDVVIQAYWERKGTDEEGNTGTFSTYTAFDLSTVDPDNFVSYDDLTEEIIIGWIESTFTDAFIEHMDIIINEEIESKIFPIIEVTSGFPWSPEEVVEPVGIATTGPVGIATTE